MLTYICDSGVVLASPVCIFTVVETFFRLQNDILVPIKRSGEIKEMNTEESEFTSLRNHDRKATLSKNTSTHDLPRFLRTANGNPGEPFPILEIKFSHVPIWGRKPESGYLTLIMLSERSKLVGQL